MLAALAVAGATIGAGPAASIALGVGLPLFPVVLWGVLLAPLRWSPWIERSRSSRITAVGSRVSRAHGPSELR
ncbi:MAG: DUF2568 domain-containing protein [Geodermatophilaceae bacterium]|nr:DUF2568 domain-containing protein [Geodermatophilaceae bacterium]